MVPSTFTGSFSNINASASNGTVFGNIDQSTSVSEGGVGSSSFASMFASRFYDPWAAETPDATTDFSGSLTNMAFANAPGEAPQTPDLLRGRSMGYGQQFNTSGNGSYFSFNGVMDARAALGIGSDFDSIWQQGSATI